MTESTVLELIKQLEVEKQTVSDRLALMRRELLLLRASPLKEGDKVRLNQKKTSVEGVIEIGFSTNELPHLYIRPFKADGELSKKRLILIYSWESFKDIRGNIEILDK